jgi:hypothetical protein
MCLDFAQRNLRNIALAIRSTGQEGSQIGEMTAAFHQMGIVLEEDVLAAFDILKRQNLGKLSPQVVASYAALGRTGVPAIRELGAALKSIEQSVGSPEAAVPVFQSLLSTLTDVEKLKVFQAGGIQVFDPDQPEVLRPINQLLGEIIARADGNVKVLGQIFDSRSLKGLNAAVEEFNRTGSIQSIDRWYQVQADGSRLQQGAAARAATFSAAVSDLHSEFRKFADSNLVGPLNEMTKFLHSLEPGTLQRWMTWAKWLGIGLGGLLAARGAFRLARDVFNAGRFVVSGGKSGGLGGGGLLGGANPVPVWVVNSGGMPGLGKLGGAGGAGRMAGWMRAAMPWLARTGAVAGAGYAGYQAGSILYDKAISGTQLGDLIGAGIARSLAFFGNDEAQAAIDRQVKFEGTLEVKLTQEGELRVGGMKSSGDGPTIQTRSTLGMVHHS